jgi:transposase
MLIRERTAGDNQRLRLLARHEKSAEQKDRLMAAALAIERLETSEIQRVLGRSRGFVQRWAYAYRDGGIEALKDKPRGGSVGKITGQKAASLRARIDAGPTEADGVCTLRGRDIQRIAKEELDTKVSLTSVYRTLHKMGYSCLAPRPRHEKQDLEAQKKFKEDSAPFL